MPGMRGLIQRVSEASVRVDGEIVGAIERGLLVLVGVTASDTEVDAAVMADKIAGLRIFGDDDGLMNLSMGDIGAGCLVVSQFTLYGDTRKGRRPSFTAAARPERAEPLVDSVVERIRTHGIAMATGVFGAMMEVSLVNDGPVSLIIETSDGRII